MNPQRPHVLVVDDDRQVLTLIGGVAQSEGFDVGTTVTGEDALRYLRRRSADLVLLDLRMPGVSGLQTLRAIREINSQCRVVLMSGQATIESAVEAVKLGAMDYFSKPFDLHRLRSLLAGAREDAAERRAVLTLEGDLAQRLEFCGMIGRGAVMQEVFDLLRRLAPHARTTLITGEAGTGKELVARALHKLGPRSSKPFVAVNCSAVVDTLLESELFGHVGGGAFTGAMEHEAGLFESADGGTVMLDELGELPARLQARVLRLLESGTVQRVGSAELRSVDIRLIAATNRDLRGEVAAGRFRADLYLQLSAAEIELPPLRDRREDVPYLTASFIRAFAHRFSKPLAGLTPAAERLLFEARWEGNVRQLRNVLESACVLAEGEFVSDADLRGIMRRHGVGDDRVAPPPDDRTPARLAPLVEIEREHIVRTLSEVRGNKAVAARLLGVSRRAFYRQLERHGLHTAVPFGRRDAAPGLALGGAS